MTVDSNFKECIFCHLRATHSPQHQMAVHGFDIWFCHPCQTEYINIKFEKSSAILVENFRCNIYTTIDDRLFKVTTNKDGAIQIFKVGTPGIPGISINKDCVMVMYFKPENAPQITPSNINEKLRTYILFS